jgi:hypothetical protein
MRIGTECSAQTKSNTLPLLWLKTMALPSLPEVATWKVKKNEDWLTGERTKKTKEKTNHFLIKRANINGQDTGFAGSDRMERMRSVGFEFRVIFARSDIGLTVLDSLLAVF